MMVNYEIIILWRLEIMPIDIGAILIITGAVLLLPIMYGVRYLVVEKQSV